MTLGGTLFGVFSKLWWVRTADWGDDDADSTGG